MVGDWVGAAERAFEGARVVGVAVANVVGALVETFCTIIDEVVLVVSVVLLVVALCAVGKEEGGIVVLLVVVLVEVLLVLFAGMGSGAFVGGGLPSRDSLVGAAEELEDEDEAEVGGVVEVFVSLLIVTVVGGVGLVITEKGVGLVGARQFLTSPHCSMNSAEQQAWSWVSQACAITLR